MKKTRFTEAQIIGILNQGGVKIADLAREHGVSVPTIYGWRRKFGGFEASEESASMRLRMKIIDSNKWSQTYL